MEKKNVFHIKRKIFCELYFVIVNVAQKKRICSFIQIEKKKAKQIVFSIRLACLVQSNPIDVHVNGLKSELNLKSKSSGETRVNMYIQLFFTYSIP